MMKISGLGNFETNKVYSVVGERVTAEVFTAGPGNKTPIESHAHADYQVTLSPITPGNYHYRGARHDIPKGSISFIHPGEAHACGGTGFREETTCWKVLMISPEMIKSYCGNASFIDDFTTTDPAIYNSFDRYFDCLWQGCPLADDLLVEAFQNQASLRQVDARPLGSHWRLENARTFLDDCTSEKPTSDEIAKVAGLNKFYFIRSFKEKYGITPQRYLLGRRVDRAKQFLRGRKLGLSEVAFECGFSDQSHMTRTFKKFVGVTPKNYA